MVYCASMNVDQKGYDEEYAGNPSALASSGGVDAYIEEYERTRIAPFHQGGVTKGYVRGLAVNRLLQAGDRLRAARNEINILDAGCGQGELSVYLSALGYNVTGVDVSAEACVQAEALARCIGTSRNCEFRADSLEKLSISNESIDFIIGHAALHHFIKYPNVPNEFYRILKKEGEGWFADSFGENKLYHLFHNKRRMEKLGDVSLTKAMIENYFRLFHVELVPADWFVMLDKLGLVVLPHSFEGIIRRMSRVWRYIDNQMPARSRLALFLSGSVMTHITKR